MKYDATIQDLLQRGGNRVIPVIVQTVDGLKDEDKSAVAALGGRIKRDLHLVEAFSADLPLASIPLLALNQRVKKIYYDVEFRIV